MRLAWDNSIQAARGEGKYAREKSATPYHSARWTKLSRMWRQQHPVCERCKAKGLIRPAQVTDHIIPYPVCADFYDTSNFQSLCEKCNIEKGNEDKVLIQEWKKQYNRCK